MSVVVVLEVVLVLAMTAVIIAPVLVALVLVTMAVLDVLVGMAAVLDVLVVTGLKTIFMITTAIVADNATNPNKTRSPIITNFLRDTNQPPIASFIPPCLLESSTSSRVMGAGPAI